MVDTAIKCSQRRQNVCWQKVLKAWNGRDPFEVLLWGQTGGPLTVYYGVHPFKTMEDLNFTSDRCSLFHKKTDVLRSKQQFLTHLLQTWHVPVQRDIELEIETGSRHRNAGVSWLCCPLGSPLSDPWPISAKSRTHYGNEHLVPYALHFYIWFVSVYNMCVCISVYVCVCVYVRHYSTGHWTGPFHDIDSLNKTIPLPVTLSCYWSVEWMINGLSWKSIPMSGNLAMLQHHVCQITHALQLSYQLPAQQCGCHDSFSLSGLVSNKQTKGRVFHSPAPFPHTMIWSPRPIPKGASLFSLRLRHMVSAEWMMNYPW